MLCCGIRIDSRLGLLVLDLHPFLPWHLVRIFRLQSILCVQVVALRMGTCTFALGSNPAGVSSDIALFAIR